MLCQRFFTQSLQSRKTVSRLFSSAWKDVQITVDRRSGSVIEHVDPTASARPLKSGECLMDQMGYPDDHELVNKVSLNYHREESMAHLTLDSPSRFLNKDGWKVYEKLFFEHSDTCPSRKFTQGLQSQEERSEALKSSTNIKLAVCCYIMDKNDNLMLTKRPSHLKIFPNVWVLPGGIVDSKETLEDAIFREIEEEVGITMEYTNEDDPDCKTFQMISPLRQDQGDSIKVDFEPFYLYESVTNSILDGEDDLIPGFTPSEEEQRMLRMRPPVAQHLCLFYKAKIDESFDRILVEFNAAEVHKLAWASLEQLADCFKGKHSDLQSCCEFDPNVFLHHKANSHATTESLYPLYKENKHAEGLGKGHYLAIRRLLSLEGRI